MAKQKAELANKEKEAAIAKFNALQKEVSPLGQRPLALGLFFLILNLLIKELSDVLFYVIMCLTRILK